MKTLGLVRRKLNEGKTPEKALQVKEQYDSFTIFNLRDVVHNMIFPHSRGIQHTSTLLKYLKLQCFPRKHHLSPDPIVNALRNPLHQPNFLQLSKLIEVRPAKPSA